MNLRPALFTLAVLAPACTQGGSPSPFGDDGGDDGATTGADASSDADASSGGAASADGGGSGTTEPDDTKWDLGGQPDVGEREPMPCENVDIVFVVDNSGSMAGEQENLVESFPGFVDEMLASLETVESLRVGVTTTDENVDNTAPCDQMGAFIEKTAYDSCGPYVEGSYMTPADPLDQTFACAATLGTGGSGNERPMDALGLALSGEYQAPGGCNAGFLRDDALLVVVVISDEEDDHESAIGNSQGDPPDWAQTVVDAKNGIETNAAVLTIVGQEQLDGCDGTPFDPNGESAEPGFRLMEFASSFTYSFVGDVCAEDYAPIFHEAISVIDEACTNFTPPAG